MTRAGDPQRLLFASCHRQQARHANGGAPRRRSLTSATKIACYYPLGLEHGRTILLADMGRPILL
jgi:hypothetical protein